MLNRTSFATVSATATRAYADASAIAISPTPNTQEAYKKLSKTSGTQRIAPSFLIPGVLRREKQQRAQPASFIWGMSVEAACRRRFRLYL
jgi:hypothetical protein